MADTEFARACKMPLKRDVGYYAGLTGHNRLLFSMEEESELDKRMGRENRAAEELQKVLVVYQGSRTSENRKAYLRALNEFSKMLTGRK